MIWKSSPSLERKTNAKEHCGIVKNRRCSKVYYLRKNKRNNDRRLPSPKSSFGFFLFLIIFLWIKPMTPSCFLMYCGAKLIKLITLAAKSSFDLRWLNISASLPSVLMGYMLIIKSFWETTKTDTGLAELLFLVKFVINYVCSNKHFVLQVEKKCDSKASINSFKNEIWNYCPINAFIF